MGVSSPAIRSPASIRYRQRPTTRASPRTIVAHVTSQMRAVPSSDAVTTRLPSGLKPALCTVPVWPLSRARSLPLSASQMRAVRSEDAVTTRLPSGLKPALCTVPVWP
jgi:hypothetical protein